MSYAGFAATAVRLITKNGAATTLRRPAVTIVDEITDVSSVSTTTYPVTVVVLPDKAPRSNTVEQASLATASFRKVLIAPDAAVEPQQNDELLWEGTWWKINGVAPLRPDGVTTVLYTVNINAM